jgi:hypothetical protein
MSDTAMATNGAVHLYETIQNTSGVACSSINFPTVHLDDVIAYGSVGDLDSCYTGTIMRDYLLCADLQHIPETATRSHDGGTQVTEYLPATSVAIV